MQLGTHQSQQIIQTLSPHLIHHLEILKFSHSALEQYIYEKGNENPLLVVEDAKVKLDYEDIMKLAFISPDAGLKNKYQTNHIDFDFVEARLQQKESYIEMLLEQIPLHKGISQSDLKILKFLIYSLDERLFLDIDMEAVAIQFQTTCEHVESILSMLKSFEPIGVGARNYQEYLFIQITNDPSAPELAPKIIANDLKLLSSNSLKQLSKKYKVPLQEMKEIVDYIKNLKPIISTDKAEIATYIIPDVEVMKFEGEWIIKLNQGHLPSLSINEYYAKILKDNADYALYYKQTLQDALNLIQGIELRNKTIYELVQILLDIQSDFFHNGLIALKPMLLKDVAQKLNVHETTISRTIRGKYIQTPQGIYALRSLFTKGIVNESGEIDSVIHIKQQIKKLIDAEKKEKPISDQQITQILCDEGKKISRRTVAKYREEMNILSSFNRAQI